MQILFFPEELVSAYGIYVKLDGYIPGENFSQVPIIFIIPKDTKPSDFEFALDIRTQQMLQKNIDSASIRNSDSLNIEIFNFLIECNYISFRRSGRAKAETVRAILKRFMAEIFKGNPYICEWVGSIIKDI